MINPDIVIKLKEELTGDQLMWVAVSEKPGICDICVQGKSMSQVLERFALSWEGIPIIQSYLDSKKND